MLVNAGQPEADFNAAAAPARKRAAAALDKLMRHLETAAGLPHAAAARGAAPAGSQRLRAAGRLRLRVPRPDRRSRDRPTSSPASSPTRSAMWRIATAPGGAAGAGLSFLFGTLLGDFVGGGAVVIADPTVLQGQLFARGRERGRPLRGDADEQDRRRAARARHPPAAHRRTHRIGNVSCSIIRKRRSG